MEAPMQDIPPIKLESREFWALGLTLLMIAYTIAVMPPIMPLVVREFSSSLGFIQGALVLFSLVTASFSPTSENLSQRYGRERVYRTALIIYGLGVLVVALSRDIGVMVLAFSFVMGVAATPLVSTPWAIMDFAYDGKQEMRATLAFIFLSTLGGLSGGLLGGWIAHQVGWRAAYIPTGLLLLIVLYLGRSLPQIPPARKDPIDWVGGMLALLGLGSILVAISLAGEFGWWEPKRQFLIAGVVIPPFAISIVPTLIAVGIVLLGLFAYWQRRQANLQGGASLLRMGLLRQRTFVIGLIVAMLHVLVVTGVQFNLYQFLPSEGFNPFQTALIVLPYNLTTLVALMIILRFLSLEAILPPRRVILFGLAFLTVGLGILYQALEAPITAFSLLPSLVIMGLGSALFLAYINALTYAAAKPEEKPEGTGIYNPCQNLGSSLGRGILGTALMFFASRSIVDGILHELGRQLSPPERRETIQRLQVMLQTYGREEVAKEFAKLPASVKPALKDIIHQAAVEGMRHSLLIGIGLSAIALVLATHLPKYPRATARAHREYGDPPLKSI